MLQPVGLHDTTWIKGSRRQFANESVEQNLGAIAHYSANMVRMHRSVKHFRRSYSELEKKEAKLSDAKKISLRASADYLLKFHAGLGGTYVCRSNQTIPASQIVNFRGADGAYTSAPPDLTCSQLIFAPGNWYPESLPNNIMEKNKQTYQCMCN